jgi:hypothetical protein
VNADHNHPNERPKSCRAMLPLPLQPVVDGEESSRMGYLGSNNGSPGEPQPLVVRR